MDLTSSAKKAGPEEFYGMMWSGDLTKMWDQNIWEAVERSGAKMLRLVIAPGDQAEVDKAFEAAAARDITILPYFGSGGFPKAGTENRENWIKYAKEMVKKYGPDSSFSHPVEVWEIWNEPNMHFDVDGYPDQEGNVNPEKFAEFFKEMSEALTSTSEKEIEVLAPGLYGYRVGGCHPECHLTPRKFMIRMDKRLSELGASNAYDALSLHPYVFKVGKRGNQHSPKDASDVKQVTKAIKRVITGLHSLSGKPLWITELGFPVANPAKKGNVPVVSKPIQKLLVKASFSMMQNNRKRLNIPHAFYYNIQDDPKLARGWEYYSGLLDAQGRARPAWTAYSNLAGGKSCPHVPC
jgi:hypothetical protein